MTKKASVSADDCRSCGACCVPYHATATYVTVSAKDIKRMLPRYRANVEVHDSRRHINTMSHVAIVDGGGSLMTKVSTPKAGPLEGIEVCSCVALRGSVGHRVSCSIYDRRPDLCRTFKPGSLACRDAREILERDS